MRIISAAKIKVLVISCFSLAIFFVIAFNPTSNSSVSAKPGSGLNKADGASIYARSCARCHGLDGRAKTAKGKQLEAADFTSSDWEPNEAKDIRIVTKGKGSMPSFKRTLKPAEIASVVAYIRRFKN